MHGGVSRLFQLIYIYIYICGPGSSVGVAADYGLDGLGSNPGGGRDFPPVQTGPGAHPASYKLGTRSSPGGNVWPRHAADHF